MKGVVKKGRGFMWVLSKLMGVVKCPDFNFQNLGNYAHRNGWGERSTGVAFWKGESAPKRYTVIRDFFVASLEQRQKIIYDEYVLACKLFSSI